MGFTVTPIAGASDAGFETYARLLSRRGVDLGNAPRAPEPGAGRRWLYVWDTREQAQAFADELRPWTGDVWKVAEVAEPPTEGPLGPIVVQVARRADGVVLELNSLGRATVRSAFPSAGEAVRNITLGFETTANAARPSVAALAADLMRVLTGLKPDQIARLGYVLIDDDTERTLAFVRPADLAPAQAERP